VTRDVDRSQRGQALPEFALVAPLFFIMVFAIIDLGRYVFVTNAFSEAAREGARYGAVEQWAYTCPASVGSPDRFACTAQATKDRLGGAPAYFNVAVSCKNANQAISLSAAQCNAGSTLTVTVSTPTSPANQKFTFFTPLIGQYVSPPVISATSQVIVQ